jgi:hypothetical protein
MVLHEAIVLSESFAKHPGNVLVRPIVIHTSTIIHLCIINEIQK